MLDYFAPMPFNKIPPALLTEKEKDLEYYKKTLQAILSKWWNSSLLFNNTSTNIFYFKHYQYYFGEQDNGVFRYLTQAGANVDLPAVYIPGQQIKQYVDYMVGTVIKQMESFNITANSLNPEMRRDLDELFTKAKIHFELQPFFDEIEKLTGMPTSPIQGFRPRTMDDIKKLQEETKTTGEETARILAENDFQLNQGHEKLRRVFFDAIMVGTGTLYQDIENEKTKWQYVPAPFSIIDRAPFSDTNKGASYAGHVMLYSVQEIIEKFNLTDEQIAHLKEVSNDTNLMLSMNGAQNGWGGVYWWWDIYSATPKVLVANVEWKDIYYDKKIASINKKDGQSYLHDWGEYSDMSASEKTAFHSNSTKKRVYSKPRTVIRRAVCIAGDIFTDCKIKENQVGYDSLGENELGYRTFTPTMMFGRNVSITQRLEPLQDERDIYSYLIRLCAARDKGKVLMYNTALMPKGYNGDIDTVITKMATQGVVEYDTARAEDANLIGNVGASKFFYVEDMGMKVTDIQAYSLMIDRIDREMQQIVSIPAVALGQQSSTIGKGVQENTAMYATIPQEWLFKGFVDYVNSLLQYSVNLSKIAYLSKGSYEGNFLLNNKQIAFLKISKDFLFEDFLIMLKADDIIDEQARMSIIQQAQAWAQTQVITPLDSLRIQKTKTYTEAEKILEQALTAQLMQKAQDQQALLQQQQLQGQQKTQVAQIPAQTQLQIAQMQEQGKDKREQTSAKARILSAAIDHASKTHMQTHEANNALIQAMVDHENAMEMQQQGQQQQAAQEQFQPLNQINQQ
jgi:hypothetical protein